ncbi:MAG: glycosyltransferase family 1 protein, partial [Patescibacteria group bacterium]
MIIGVDGNEANVERRVGSNQYAFELLHALYNLPEAKKHEWMIYLRDTPLPDMPKEISWWKYKVFGPKRLWTQFALPLSLFFAEPRPEVFFTPGHYRPRWSPIPTVVSIMDLGYLRYPDQFTRRDLYQLTSWTAHSIKKSDHVIAISESTKRDIIRYYKIPRSKITVTYPGYDKNKFKNQISKIKIREVKKKYNIKDDYILFLSTLKPSKNIEGLLTAFSLITNHPAEGEARHGRQSLITLVIAGKKGWLYESIFKKVKELDLEDKRSLPLRDKVVFTDFIPDDDVPLLMAGALVFVLPSFWEGFGIPVVEAMAVGTPVVVSTVGSLPEVVGDAGILVNPDDPGDIARGIKEALKNYDALSKKGLERTKLFDWQKAAQQTLEV